MKLTVIKNNGSREELNLDKLHKVVTWACQGLRNVSVSEVELKAQIQFFDKIKTSTIQETLIKAAADLIEEQSDYQYVAGRLLGYHLRKLAYGQYAPPSLFDHIQKITNLGFYHPEIIQDYTKEEIDLLDQEIDHEKDFKLSYAGMAQFQQKYLVKDKSQKNLLETPQMAYMLIAMTVFSKRYQGAERLQIVKDYYHAISNFDISLPSPIMAGLRTPTKQFSSCVLIESDDSLDSIKATTNAIVSYVSKKAGIGISGSALRALNDKVGPGDVIHTGVTPFYRLWQSAVESCSQGGLRRGSATLNVLFWHPEIMNILSLKNSKGTEENRARNLDYCVLINKTMYERLLQKKNITLFSPKDVPEVYQAYFGDSDKFKELYEKAERTTKIPRKTISAEELFGKLVQERAETGRIYILNVDHANKQTPLKEPIKMTNLCVEILQHTSPVSLDQDKGLIALCTLSALNMAGKKIEKNAELVVKALDALLDYQDYMEPAAERHTMLYRPLGIGVTNLAYFLAKNRSGYAEPNLELVDEWFETMTFYCIKASMELAKRFGPCIDTKYHDGLFPKDLAKDKAKDLVKRELNLDWEGLSEDCKKYGVRNATLFAIMPSETSSLISNSTNGIDQVRSLITFKSSNDGPLPQVVPEVEKLGKHYELLWDSKSMKGMISIAAIIQKWFDQSISLNLSYVPSNYPDNNIPLSLLLNDILYAYQMGIKTLYYHNTRDGSGEVEIKEENCESCSI